jgi:hypothetical protein
MNLETANKWAPVLAAVLVVPQIAVAVWSIYQTNRRDRMKTTLDYYEKVNQDIKREKREIGQKYGHKITREICHQIHEERIDTSKANKILNSYERLALGANLGVYDVRVLNRVSGRLLIENYERFEDYIEYRRELKEAPAAWIEFEKLTLKLRSLRRKRFWIF